MGKYFDVHGKVLPHGMCVPNIKGDHLLVLELRSIFDIEMQNINAL